MAMSKELPMASWRGDRLEHPRLSEILRPFKEVVDLRLGYGVVVDDALGLQYRQIADGAPDAGGFRPLYPELVITRELTEPIIVSSDPERRCMPYSDTSQRVGQFDSFTVGLRPSRPIVYVGEDYMIGFLERDTDEGTISFGLASRNPLTVSPFNNADLNVKAFLRDRWGQGSNT
jgi:hypothetical protein